MMNLLQVQDDLKNFSQDQLVKEMQQPTGSTPQFLVLTELNRRKRVKGDYEARQSQNQPTVAQEAVASAGVPQEGMMGMPEAMAPQSAVSEGVGTSAPMNMASGGLMQFGNEIRESMGQEIEPYLQEVENEAESKFNVDLGNNMGGLNPMRFEHAVPRPGRIDLQQLPGPRIPTFTPGMGGKGMPRPAVMPQEYLRGGDHIAAMNRNAFGSRRYAEGGVIRAQDGLPNNKYRPFDEYPEYPEGYEYTPDDTRLDRIFKGTGQIIHDTKPYLPFHPEFMKVIGNDAYQFFNQPVGEIEAEKEEEKDAENIDQALNDATTKSTTELKTEEKDETKPLTLEEELVKRQAGLDKDRNFDKYMALAQAGLGILASDKPTLAGAIGEGGMKGLDAFNAANKRYEEGLNDILNARVKLKSANKSGLTQKDAISAINGIDANIARLEKGSETFQYDDAKMKEIRNKIAQLEFQKESLMPSAGYGRLSRNVSDSANTKS